MRVYIAGPISGTCDFLGRFEAAADRLERMGHEPSNPAWRRALEGHFDGDGQWSEAMRKCIRDLLGCEGYTLLHGWEESLGAVTEVVVARAIGLAYVPLDISAEEVDQAVLTVRFEVKPFAVEDWSKLRRYYSRGTVERILEDHRSSRGPAAAPDRPLP